MTSARQQLRRHAHSTTRQIERTKRVFLLLALAGILLFMLTACTLATGNGSKWTVASLGSDISNLEVSGSGFKADKIDNSTAFREASKQVRVMWQSYLMLQGLEFIGGRYFDKAGQEISSSQTIKLQELQNAKDVRTAELRLEELKLFPLE
jgi:hypothetical protein